MFVLILGAWTPTDIEIESLHSNPKRRKIENNSSVGELDVYCRGCSEIKSSNCGSNKNEVNPKSIQAMTQVNGVNLNSLASLLSNQYM